ncbi:MAG: hypothetical protein AAFZ91_04730 [Pseudomonadota bacterium]
MAIKPPTNTNSEPDEATKKAGKDFTSEGPVDERVFRIKWFGMTYGTDDKAHGAALFIAILLVGVMLILGIAGGIVGALQPEVTVFERAFSVLGSLLSFVAGAAIGRSGVLNGSD